MTPKQILDSFSETLMRDERILSAAERGLLNTLLQHAKAASGHNPETQQAVHAVIASAVGETMAQRAFAVLGASIVQKILESSSIPAGDLISRTGDIYATEPQPPGKPRPAPGVPNPPSPEPQPPGKPRPQPIPPSEPQPPGAQPPPKKPPIPRPDSPSTPSSPGEPQPPGHGIRTTVVSEASVAVTERPAILPARALVLDEFLAPQEVEALMQYALDHEADFQTSEVVSPIEDHGVVNYEHRRSRVLMNLGPHQQVVLERIKAALPSVLRKLEMDDFCIAEVEAQITASNDGDFFRFHSDSGSERVASRYLTFVYFFHREPRPFEGGELYIHDARLEDGHYVSDGKYQKIVPQQNQIVFFPCELLHEINPVRCPSGLFADSRFTMNGWLRR